MFFVAFVWCIQSKIKWQLTRALIAYPSPVSTEPDGFEEFVSEIEKGKIEKLSKKKSNGIKYIYIYYK